MRQKEVVVGSNGRVAGVHIVLMFGVLGGSISGQEPSQVTSEASDGATVYGERYFGSLDDSAPLILLFHQGGSNGRGEYADLAPQLNDAGFRALAWDLRAGGDTYGSENRTATNLSVAPPVSFCDAYPDLQAALDFVTSQNLARRVILWGSSYSGALVFRLAAENQASVSAVVAFSPASGEPMVGCQARRWVEQLATPVAVFRPRSEMSRESSIDQQRVLSQAGVEFFVVERGVHGASMLVDSRTDSDMSEARQLVFDWLRNASTARTP